MKEQTESFDSAVKMLCGEIAAMLLKIPDSKKQMVQEIRLRSGKPIALTSGTETLFVCNDGSIVYSAERAAICSKKDMYDTFRQMCGYSVYSKQNEIRNGYITLIGGHRVGVCGTADVREGIIHSVTDITSMNIRISRQIRNAAQKLMPYITPMRCGILIAGAPSTGKTTMLRDIAYRLSVGKECKVMRTCVIDERGELSGGCNEDSGIDLGLCDVLRNYPKGEGVQQAIRALSPQVIICDEVGTEEDALAVAQGANAGAYIIATVHASGKDELLRRKQTRLLLDTGAFGRIVILDSADKPCSFSDIAEVSDRRYAV